MYDKNFAPFLLILVCVLFIACPQMRFVNECVNADFSNYCVYFRIIPCCVLSLLQYVTFAHGSVQDSDMFPLESDIGHI